MTEWFSDLSSFDKFYWVVAGISSVIFIFVLIATFVGGDTDDIGDVDAEIDADTGGGFQFFTFKNTVAFFTIFGWTGITMIDAGSSKLLIVTVSFISGLIMMAIMASLFYYISKLVSSGTLKMENALHGIAVVIFIKSFLVLGDNV